MIRTIVFLLIMFNSMSLLEAKSISQHGKYLEFCKLAALDDKVFNQFKKNPYYRCILEHATYEQGLQYLEVLTSKESALLHQIELFSKNDQIGNPVTYDYPRIGKFSPTTLQYIKIAHDIFEYFEDLSSLHIVEIGGGYGGQCFILSLLNGFSHYTMIDLPECLPLADKYLKAQNVSNVDFFNPQQLDSITSCDFVISNYAFSEIDYQEQLDYLNKILKKAPRGYMTINFISKLFDVNSLTPQNLILYLEGQGAEVQAIPEYPQTGDGNLIIVWKPLEN